MLTALIPIDRDMIRLYPDGKAFNVTQPRTTEQLISGFDPTGVGVTLSDVLTAIRAWHGVHCEDGFVYFFEDILGRKSDGSPFCYGIRFYKITWRKSEIIHVQLVREWGRGCKGIGGRGEFILLPVFEL